MSIRYGVPRLVSRDKDRILFEAEHRRLFRSPGKTTLLIDLQARKLVHSFSAGKKAENWELSLGDILNVCLSYMEGGEDDPLQLVVTLRNETHKLVALGEEDSKEALLELGREISRQAGIDLEVSDDYTFYKDLTG